MTNKFEAQTLSGTATRAASQTFEMIFVDANGATLTVSLPLRVAADALVPVLSTLEGAAGPKPVGAPSFSKNVARWQVGRANELPNVLFQMNDDVTYAMHVTDAKKFWRELREEAEAVERRGSPTRQ